MATNTDVQFFSHLNGLNLGNNWGDLLTLLDTCLVNGLPLTTVTAASIDSNGDLHLTLYAAHNCLLFQVIELAGFSPSGLNGKYRIIGTPAANQLILKASLTGSVTTTGTAKLASLGYEIAFTGIGKRAYRAKNPTAQHPFIRVDETLSDGSNSYPSAYAKYAMVGLIEGMTHIDDYTDSSKLQLPLDTTDFSRNWKITGSGDNAVRGWAKWYWSSQADVWTAGVNDSAVPATGNRDFTLCGNADAFYLLLSEKLGSPKKVLSGCGLFNSALASDVIPNWFLMAFRDTHAAGANYDKYNTHGASPLIEAHNNVTSHFSAPAYNVLTRVSPSVYALPILPNFGSGYSGVFNASNIAALEVPFYDEQAYLRGGLKHVCYSGKASMPTVTTPYLADQSMYVADSAANSSQIGGFYFYLGGLA